MPGDADIAAVAEVLADRSRSRMLWALADGRALPASRLAAEAGIAASTSSAHLSRLVGAGMLVAEPHGRHRYYRLAGPHVAELLEAIARVAPPLPARSLRELDRFEQLGWVARRPASRAVSVTEAGERGLRRAVGLNVADLAAA